MGGKYTKVKKGALFLWEENTQNLKRVLCYCGRKIYKTLKWCSVTEGRKCTKRKKGALLVWEENTQNFKKVLCYCGKKMHKT